MIQLYRDGIIGGDGNIFSRSQGGAAAGASLNSFQLIDVQTFLITANQSTASVALVDLPQTTTTLLVDPFAATFPTATRILIEYYIGGSVANDNQGDAAGFATRIIPPGGAAFQVDSTTMAFLSNDALFEYGFFNRWAFASFTIGGGALPAFAGTFTARTRWRVVGGGGGTNFIDPVAVPNTPGANGYMKTYVAP